MWAMLASSYGVGKVDVGDARVFLQPWRPISGDAALFLQPAETISADAALFLKPTEAISGDVPSPPQSAETDYRRCFLRPETRGGQLQTMLSASFPFAPAADDFRAFPEPFAPAANACRRSRRPFAAPADDFRESRQPFAPAADDPRNLR